MEPKKFVASLVAVLALLVVVMGSVSAATVNIASVEVGGVDALLGSTNVVAVAGQAMPVRVIFDALSGNVTDARVRVWISARDKDYSVSTERFDILAGGTYSKFFAVQIPQRIDPDERLYLEIQVDSPQGQLDYESIPLNVQRESYKLEILDVNMEHKVQAGESVIVDLVLKNRGRQFAEDTFITARVPALGIERRAYFGDLSPVDQPVIGDNPDRLDNEDAVERRLVLNIPASAPAGIYTIEFEAVSADASESVSKKFAVMGASGNSIVATSSVSKTFGVSEKGMYSITLVNSGKNVRVYELTAEAPAGLTVEAEEPVVAVPAGTSKTVKISAKAVKIGKYVFTVDVAADGDLVKRESFTADVTSTGKAIGSTEDGATANTTVVLTVVLAIIFVVLLVVLIVLLTRKPQKTEEIGESYY